jgi:hypothetical protein
LRGADGEELPGGRGAARTARSSSAARSVRDDPATEGTRQRRGAAGASAVRGGEQQDNSSLLQTAGEESGERESRGKGMSDGRKRKLASALLSDRSAMCAADDRRSC